MTVYFSGRPIDSPMTLNILKPFGEDTKLRSKLLEIGGQTSIYSFRHTGAIEIYKRTGSIHKLQRAMGHSSLNVSLTYLRGLEVAELKEEDMPMVQVQS